MLVIKGGPVIRIDSDLLYPGDVCQYWPYTIRIMKEPMNISDFPQGSPEIVNKTLVKYLLNGKVAVLDERSLLDDALNRGEITVSEYRQLLVQLPEKLF